MFNSLNTRLPLLTQARCKGNVTNLMNDATARPPETNTILGASTSKEVVYFLVGLDSILQVSLATKLVLPVCS